MTNSEPDGSMTVKIYLGIILTDYLIWVIKKFNASSCFMELPNPDFLSLNKYIIFVFDTIFCHRVTSITSSSLLSSSITKLITVQASWLLANNNNHKTMTKTVYHILKWGAFSMVISSFIRSFPITRANKYCK